MIKRKKTMVILVAAIAAVLMTGCEQEPPRVSIENPEVQFSGAIKGEAIVFLSIVNKGGPDSLVSVRSEIPGSSATVHQMRGGLMVIAKSFPIPANAYIQMAPMTSHIMLENLPKDVKPGFRFTLTLVFERSGEVRVPLEFSKPSPGPAEQPITHNH